MDLTELAHFIYDTIRDAILTCARKQNMSRLNLPVSV